MHLDPSNYSMPILVSLNFECRCTVMECDVVDFKRRMPTKLCTWTKAMRMSIILELVAEPDLGTTRSKTTYPSPG